MAKTNNNFFGNFLIDSLWSVLTQELDCTPTQASNHIDWFHREARYFPQQESQDDYNDYARDEVIKHVGRGHLRKRPPKIDPAVAAAELPGWSPCQHWGGSRLCGNCLDSKVVAGAMRRAQELYERHHRFVPWYLTTVKGIINNDALVEDLTSAVWHAVASRVRTFTVIGAMEADHVTTAQAWLKKVIDTVVFNHNRDQHAAKRPVEVITERETIERYTEEPTPEKPTAKTPLPDEDDQPVAA